MFREKPLQRQKRSEREVMKKPAGRKNMAGLPDEGKRTGHEGGVM
jgi:hypothetical protein